MATVQEVSKLFISLFNRVADANESAKWQKSGDYSVSLINALLDTPEGATLRNAQTQTFVETIYENALGKSYADDPEGIKWWVNAINTNKWSKADFLFVFFDTVQKYRDGIFAPSSAEKDAISLHETKISLAIFATTNIQKDIPASDVSKLTFGSGLSEIKASNMATILSTIQGQIKKLGGDDKKDEKPNNESGDNANKAPDADKNTDSKKESDEKTTNTEKTTQDSGANAANTKALPQGQNTEFASLQPDTDPVTLTGIQPSQDGNYNIMA